VTFLRQHILILTLLSIETFLQIGNCSSKPPIISALALTTKEKALSIAERRSKQIEPLDKKIIAEEYLLRTADTDELVLGPQTLTTLGDINVYRKKGTPILVIAAETGCVATVNRLLDIPGINVECKDNDGLTALHKAAKHGHLSVVTILLEKSPANINAQGGSLQRSALHWAAENAHFDVVNYLIKKGANVNLYDKSIATPLISALIRYIEKCSYNTEKEKSDFIKIINLLIVKKTDHSLQTPSILGKTALHLAVIAGLESVVELMLKSNSASKEITDDDEKKPIDYATSESMRRLLE